MGLSACYSASLTNDKNRYLRVTVIGADKTTANAMPVAIYSTEVPMRDAIPEWMTDLMRGRKRDMSKVTSGQGNLAGITTGNVTMDDKSITLTLGDDKVFDLGKLHSQMYRSILKNMLVGETFKASTSDTAGVKPIGVAGNVMYTGGSCPNFVYGTDVKYLFLRQIENRIAYGEGKTIANTFIESASFSQIAIIIEVKTVHASGLVEVQRAFGCGSNIRNQSADDQNKFAVDFAVYSDGIDYDNFLIDGGLNADSDTSTDIKGINVKYVITNASLASPTASIADDSTLAVGDLAMVKTSAGACTIYKCTSVGTTTGTGVWSAITGTCTAGTLVFSTQKASALTAVGKSTEYSLHAYKTVSSASVGTLINTTITATTSSSITLATTNNVQIKDFDFSAKAFYNYIG